MSELVCSRTDTDELEPIVEQISMLIHGLYVEWKARSFLLLDVAPKERSPGGMLLRVLYLSSLPCPCNRV